MVVLRGTEDQPGPDPLELALDVHPAVGEVEVLLGEAEDLALTHAAASAEVDHRLVPPREARLDGEYLVELPRHDPSSDRPGLLDRLGRARVLRDPLVIDGRAEDAPQVREDDRAGRHGDDADHAPVPLADVAGLDGRELAVAEVRVQVLADLVLGRLPGRLVERPCPEPALGVLPEQHPARRRVDVRAAELVRLDRDEVRLGVALGPVGEGLAALLAVRADVPDAVPVAEPVSHCLDALGPAVRVLDVPVPPVLDVSHVYAA